MSWILREYQQRAVERGVRFLKEGRVQGGLIVQPTGAGKSLVIAGIVQGVNEPCLIFQPSKEILEQNANKLIGYGYDPKIYSASMKQKDVGQITLATIGSVKKDPSLFDHVPYVIIDEAHLVNSQEGMYKSFIDALGDVRVIGLTATPYRLHTDGYGGSMLKFLTRTRPRVFSEVVAYAQIPELIAQGYLVKPQYQAVPGFNAKELAVNTTGADYDDDSIKRHFKRIGFNDRLRRVVVRLLEIQRKPILVFTRFVEDAERLVAQVPGCAVVSAKTKPSMREHIIAGFRAGTIPVVANVGVLNLGFDFPELATVVLARPTMSLSLYYQQVGRLLRPAVGKSEPWVVDMVDQVPQFGKVEDLWLQPGGTTGEAWEVVSRTGPVERILTNRYLGDGRFKPKQGPWNQWRKPPWKQTG